MPINFIVYKFLKEECYEKNTLGFYVASVYFVFALSACVPYSFSTPMQIHINAGDKVEHAVIAVDGDGRSHIAGIVADRVVYYHTLHGEPCKSSQWH